MWWTMNADILQTTHYAIRAENPSHSASLPLLLALGLAGRHSALAKRGHAERCLVTSHLVLRVGNAHLLCFQLLPIEPHSFAQSENGLHCILQVMLIRFECFGPSHGCGALSHNTMEQLMIREPIRFPEPLHLACTWRSSSAAAVKSADALSRTEATCGSSRPQIRFSSRSENFSSQSSGGSSPSSEKCLQP